MVLVRSVTAFLVPNKCHVLTEPVGGEMYVSSQEVRLSWLLTLGADREMSAALCGTTIH